MDHVQALNVDAAGQAEVEVAEVVASRTGAEV